MKRALLAFGLSVAAAACGTSHGEAASTPTMAVAELAEQYCALVAPCCAGAGLAPNAATCENDVARREPGPLDAARAHECLDAVRASSSAALFCRDGAELDDQPACDLLSTSVGDVPRGASCAQQSNTSVCAPSADGQVGCEYVSGAGPTCLLQLRGDEGAAPCVGETGADGAVPRHMHDGALSIDAPPRDSVVYCDRTKNLHCDFATRACAPPHAVGQPCSHADYECTQRAHCDTNAQKCAADLALGATCPGLYDGECGPDAYCDVAATARVCKAFVPFGAPCDATSKCVTGACDPASGKCVRAFGPATTLCGP